MGASKYLCIPLLLLVSCQNSPTALKPATENVLLPINVGNTWKWVMWLDIDADMDTVIGIPDTHSVQSIISDSTVKYKDNRYTVGIMSTVLHPDLRYDLEWFYWNGSKGLYLMGGRSDTDQKVSQILRYKYPVEIGESWEARRIGYTWKQVFEYIDPVTITCVGIDETLVTPAGTFQCVVYHYRIKPEEDVLEEWDIYDYYAPGIGLVGSNTRSSLDGRLKWVFSIYEYQLYD